MSLIGSTEYLWQKLNATKLNKHLHSLIFFSFYKKLVKLFFI